MSFKRLPGSVRSILAFAVAMLAFWALPAVAQTDTGAKPAPKASDVVVTIGQDTITEADISFAAEDLAQELSTIPANQRRAFLVAVLIDMKVMAEGARTAKLDETDLFKQRLAYLEDRALRRAYVTEKVNGAVTDDAIAAVYDKYVAGFVPEEEVHARHILVSSEDDAKAAKAEIEGGKPFEIAALEYSQDDTAQNGGDLGYFSKTSPIVKPFMDAAFALEVGQLSDPVQTQFGWHLIRIDDKRMSSPQPMGQIRAQLRQQVMIDAFTAEMEKLRKNATITYADPALEAAVKAESEAVTAAEE